MKMLLWLALVQMRFTLLLVILKASFTFWKQLKTQKENIKKPSEIHQKIYTTPNSLIFGVLQDFFTKNTIQKESIHLDLWLKSYCSLKFSGIYSNLEI